MTATAPRTVRPVLLRQDWREVAFLHWPLDPAVAAARLPAGTRPDVLDGRTFVGVVALVVHGTGLLGGPPIPWLGTFGQVNVRLYSVDAAGRRGVFFLSLDADRLPPALAARRLAGLPCAWSRIRVERDGDRRSYRLQRHRAGPRPVRAHLRLRVGARREPGPLEHFLTARWGMHVRVLGRTGYGGVAHAPWPLHAAEAEYEGTLLAAAGLPEVSGPPLGVLFSPGVDGARIGPPT